MNGNGEGEMNGDREGERNRDGEGEVNGEWEGDDYIGRNKYVLCSICDYNYYY